VDLGFLTDPRYDFLGAFWTTVQLSFWAAVGSFVLGLALAAMRVSPVTLMRGFATAYVAVFRNVPLTLIMIMMSQVVANQLGVRLAVREAGVNPQGFLDAQNFRLAVVGLAVYTASFVCEAIRSGINTVPPGQAEAARAIGLPFSRVLGLIVLPQALRAVIAPLGSVLIALIKNTTIASAIGVAEAGALMNLYIENEPDDFPATFLSIALGFVVITLPVGLFFGWWAKRMAVRR
jgi:glutamate transport system permease protein